MNKYNLDTIINRIREEMSISAGGGAGFKGSSKNDSGSPTAGYDPVLEFDGRKKRYKSLSKFYQDSVRNLKNGNRRNG